MSDHLVRELQTDSTYYDPNAADPYGNGRTGGYVDPAAGGDPYSSTGGYTDPTGGYTDPYGGATGGHTVEEALTYEEETYEEEAATYEDRNSRRRS